MIKALISRSLYQSRLAVIITVCLLLSGLILANYKFSNEVPGGEDLFINWKGTQMFFKEGIDPYNDTGINRIEQALTDIPQANRDAPVRFLSPLYITLFLFPSIFITNPVLARALWMSILEIALMAQIIFCLKLFDWRPSRFIFAMLLGLSLFSFYSFESLIKGDYIILIALSITSGILCIKLGWDELAGILFAISSIIFHSVALILVYIGFWTYMNRRYKIIIWFAITMCVLTLASILLMPSWPIRYLIAMVNYINETPVNLLGNEFALLLPGLGVRIGWILSAMTLLLMVIEWWLSLRHEWRGFLWTTTFTLTAGLWIGVWVEASNLLYCMPVLILLFSIWVDRWPRMGKWLVVATIIVSLFSGWLLYFSDLGTYSLRNALVLIFVPALLMMALYWMKWWAIKSTKTWLEAFYSQENPPRR